MLPNADAVRRWRSTRAKSAQRAFRPRPRIDGSEWANQHGFLPKDSPEPGRFRIERVPYLREPLNAVCDPAIETVVGMKGSQIGWTVAIYGMGSGYYIHQRPRPILVYQPTQDDAKAFARDKLGGIIEASPSLMRLVGETVSRESGNTTLRKVYPGGHLDILWASTTRAFRQRTAAVVFADEIDEYPTTEKQGDPIRLMESRLTAFRHPTLVLGSTPTIKGSSRIEVAYDRSDQRKYFVPCPHCDHGQVLVWGGPEEDRGLKWDAELVGGRKVHVPGTVSYLCEHCHVLIEERHKSRMVAEGIWTAQKPGAAAVGFHITQLITHFHGTRWEALVSKWDEVYDNAEELQPFMNNVLAETWEERDLDFKATRLEARAEKYPAEVPNGVGVLVASADIQHDRIEFAVKGYGAGEESWLIGHHRIHGETDNADAETWKTLLHELTREYVHESGRKLRIRASMIDAGDQSTSVQRFVAGKEGMGIYALMGTDSRQKQTLRRAARRNKHRVRLWTVDTFELKKILSRRLKINEPGPRYMHMCPRTKTGADAEYFAQFGAMGWRRRRIGGRMVLAPYQIGERDEAIDLEVYALAALYSLGDPLVKRLGDMADKLREPIEEEAEETVARPAPRRKKNWATGWKK